MESVGGTGTWADGRESKGRLEARSFSIPLWPNFGVGAKGSTLRRASRSMWVKLVVDVDVDVDVEWEACGDRLGCGVFEGSAEGPG